MTPVVHRAVTAAPTASWFTDRFARNGWSGSWSGGVYDWHHYHATTHEVLGCHRGSAVLRLGGEDGDDVVVGPGDVIVIPAGLAHCRLAASEDFQVVGAYPGGVEPDIQTGGGIPCPLPKWDLDPVFGSGPAS
ncbi:cupin domain-containing protein [Paracoccus sp. T5]|uniref:cupin domain-containing protein n=1 Tax=Paracoccus sp. T5 TaxID=3402161 RepID=UPI003AEA3729